AAPVKRLAVRPIQATTVQAARPAFARRAAPPQVAHMRERPRGALAEHAHDPRLDDDAAAKPPMRIAPTRKQPADTGPAAVATPAEAACRFAPGGPGPAREIGS